MSRMGSSCSTQRNRGGGRHGTRTGDGILAVGGGGCCLGRFDSGDGNSSNKARRTLRHSVVSAVPDGSIEALYPEEDNFIPGPDIGRRSPKSLATLATDALCRSLAHLEGELPVGLPQDVVDDIVSSLLQHSALNATTLRVLRNCELGTLSLARCRGVTDEWLQPLSSPAYSYPILERCPPEIPITGTSSMPESMDVDHAQEQSNPYEHYPTKQEHGHATQKGRMEEQDDLSCSTSSFVSAASNPYADASQDDQPMMDAPNHDQDPEDLPTPPELSTMMMMWSPVASVTANLTLLDLRGSQNLTDRGLMQLSDLSRLEVAKLDNCHALIGRGLIVFQSSHRLHTLSLANCRRLTDEAVINIAHLQCIEALSLDGCRCLTDRSLAALADMYSLRLLGLSQCDLFTDNGLEQLENLGAIEELSLGWCRQITDTGVACLTRQPDRANRLRILRLARCPITDVGVGHLASLKALEELDLTGCARISSAALGETLAELTNLSSLEVSYCPGIMRSGFQGKINKLKTLELSYSGVKDSHLGKLTNLPALEELNLDSCPVGDWTIAHFADNNVVPNLKSLDLADTDLTDRGMAKIAQFENLTRLSLFYCNISNAGLRHIAKLGSLEVLNLDSREISDDGLRHLQHLKSLKSLDIFSGRITDAGCTYIAGIRTLESLELCGGGVGDMGCTILATIESLTSLNLSQNERITNRGAAALAALTNLRALNLSNTRVNSSALRFFAGLVKLQSLAMYGCRGIDDTERLDKLQNDLPNLKCLRLNNASDQDGVVMTDGSSEDEDDDDDDSGLWSDNNNMARSEIDMHDIDEYSDHD